MNGMELPSFLARLKNFRRIRPVGTRRKIDREMLLGAGMVVLGLCLTGLILWDGYVFYSTFFEPEGGEENVAARSTPSLSSEEIDEVMKILDGRHERLEKILGESPIPNVAPVLAP
jgi:hypothetical protein